MQKISLGTKRKIINFIRTFCYKNMTSAHKLPSVEKNLEKYVEYMIENEKDNAQ